MVCDQIASSFNFFGDDAVFEHLGVAVRSITPELRAKKIYDPIQNVNVVFVQWGNLNVELVEPVGPKSPVINLLKNHQHLYHLCFRVNDLARSATISRRHGFRRISQPTQAIALDNRRIIWLYSQLYGLFEVVEAAPAQ